MALSAFDDKARQPTAEDLAGMLGRSLAAWTFVHEQLATQYGPITALWAFSGAKYGWSQRVLSGKRVMVYLIPQRRHFLAGIVLGEKATKAALARKLPPDVRSAVENAPKYAEGRGFRLPVRTETDARAILQLVACKMTP